MKKEIKQNLGIDTPYQSPLMGDKGDCKASSKVLMVSQGLFGQRQVSGAAMVDDWENTLYKHWGT